MAIPLGGETLIDPHGGRADLEGGVLRILHRHSFVDDPTRALRAARYAARYGLVPEPETDALLRAADLATVSADRRDADLLRLAAEPNAPKGFAMLAGWGLIEPRRGGLELVARVAELLSAPPWRDVAPSGPAVLAAALGPPGREEELAAAQPGRPSKAVELAAHSDPVALVLARALGAEWLDRYILEWRGVKLEIDGDDLIAAGIPQGPAVGRGLNEALRRKLDGEVAGRAAELEVALAVARRPDGVA
jgi:tRNA nucleotidyltransferase (CCA-adding enzyme)